MFGHQLFMKEAGKIAARYAGEHRVFLFYADIAEFRLINYFYGTKQGDELLLAVEGYLSQIPQVQLYERIFSDYFAFVVVTDAPRSDDALIETYQRYADTFIAAQKEKYPAGNLKIYCGICPLGENNLSETLDHANIARKQARESVVRTVVVFNRQMQKNLQTNIELEKEVNTCLWEKRFTFVLQPKVNMLTGEIVGAEALARRVTPEGEIIYPDFFLSIMERNGSIVDMDYLILEHVCVHMAERLRRGLPVVPTSVNLSLLHVLDESTAFRIHEIVQQYKVPARLLEFELTETIFTEELAGAKRLVERLRNLHYSVAIDDFGSGYAGITLWQELDFNVLKLDRRFLSEEEPLCTRNQAIVPNIVNIAWKLDNTVICEGIETYEQCQYMLNMGCTIAQGFYFSRAVPAEEFYQKYQEVSGYFPIFR